MCDGRLEHEFLAAIVVCGIEAAEAAMLWPCPKLEIWFEHV